MIPEPFTPDYLFIDAVCRAYVKTEALPHATNNASADAPPADAPPRRRGRPRSTRTIHADGAVRVQSRYVNVVVVRTKRTKRPIGWMARGSERGRLLQGPRRPFTDAGEIQAACDVAQFRGWDGPRLRTAEGVQ